MSEVKILRYPTEEDWQLCRDLARSTVGKPPLGGTKEVSDRFKREILRAEHSPIRVLNFVIEMRIPYYCSVHFARHKFGVEHFVTSQRNDRQADYDRRAARQDAEVVHVMYINAQALVNMARARLCNRADPETRWIMGKIAEKVCEACHEFNGLLVPKCVYRGGLCGEPGKCPADWNRAGTDSPSFLEEA